MTSAAKALSGCTGMGMRYHSPENTCISPNRMSTDGAVDARGGNDADEQRQVGAQVAKRAGQLVAVEADGRAGRSGAGFGLGQG